MGRLTIIGFAEAAYRRRRYPYSRLRQDHNKSASRRRRELRNQRPIYRSMTEGLND